MFKIESYVTPILLSYVDKYVRDFNPADAQVSLWGGGVALHNLVLKADVLQQEVSLPFTLVSGRIHELLIQVPWTKVMSEPIIVTIDTIECVLSLNPSSESDDTPPAAAPPSRNTEPMEAPPGYMQALVRRIVNNIALRVHHLIVKYVQDDVVLSLNVKHLAVDSAGPNWEPAFADIDQLQPMIRRLVRLDDLTLCLDKSDADGKIRFFQEPLLYRCQLDFRVQTRLISANTRRATNLDVQLRSCKLAFSVTNEQLVLLIRLVQERAATNSSTTSKAAPTPKQASAPAAPNPASSNTVEPARQGSWSEWAWSWLPSLADRESDVAEMPVEPTALPVTFNAFLDDISLMFKLMEMESSNRKRSRAVLEICATHAALFTDVCVPTRMRVRCGVRELTVRSSEKCVCGYVDYKATRMEPTIFLQKAPQPQKESSEQKPWTWPENLFNENVPSSAFIIVDENKATPSTASSIKQPSSPGVSEEMCEFKVTDKPGSISMPVVESDKNVDEIDELWQEIEPIVYVDFLHERKPNNPAANPYDNPPKDFEYSDWIEDCNISVVLGLVDVRVCMGLVHRLMALKNIFTSQQQDTICLPKRILTVEEKEALSENLPQKCLKLDVRNLRVRLIQWNHSLTERPVPDLLLLEVQLPSTNIIIMEPMYSYRVCSAACQMPDDTGPLWQGSRRRITVNTNGVEVRLANMDCTESRPCARLDVTLVTHELLHKTFFDERNSVEISYNLKIKELSVCGSSARLQAAVEVLLSLYLQRRSVPLKHTTLQKDALNDQDAVAIDVNLEDFSIRGYITSDVSTHMTSLKSAKITALHEPKGGSLRQAWLLSAPDAPMSNPYLRMAVQWCKRQIDHSFDYCGIWTQSLAMAVDPLLISWLAYQPEVKSEASLAAALKSMVLPQMTQETLRRRSIATSSGRKSMEAAELVHVRSRSQCSSEHSEKKKNEMPHIAPKHKPVKESWLNSDRMTALHTRLRSLLLNVELGLALVYVTVSTASALDCATLRDAMERHASCHNNVLGICLGRLSMDSNSGTQGLWKFLQTDGPTYVDEKPPDESFPWKITLADVSCYTLEVHSASVPGISEVMGQEQAGVSAGLKSKLRIPKIATPKTVLELVTTTLTVSVVSKSIYYKKISMKERTRKAKEPPKDEREQYFTAGKDFKPSTLKDFLRGPLDRLTKGPIASPSVDLKEETYNPAEITVEPGPMVSLGINIHADTPPILIRLEQDQVHIVAAAIHCFNHIFTLLNRPMLNVPKDGFASTSLGDRSIIRSVTEEEEAPSETSEENSEFIAIFDRSAQRTVPLKTFFWFQWVVSRLTVVIASETVKLALVIDDVISTVNIQTEYNQFKIKLSSLSIKHFKWNDEEWTTGVLGGRVLEAREPSKAEEDDHFLSVTVTQALISNLPANWKEELHPKLLEKNSGEDYTWEVYATLAPLEAVLQPNIVENLMSLVDEMSPEAFCTLENKLDLSTPDRLWPYVYLNAGGIRMLVLGEETETTRNVDDTIILTIGKLTINPHPDNPVCRRAVNAGQDGSWMAATGGFDGRQYEVAVQSLSVQTSSFKEITIVEAANEASRKSTGTENPAQKWAQKIQMPTMLHILHPVELSFIFAPALYVNNTLACGPAVELNLVSDCSLEFSIAQLVLIKQMGEDFAAVSDPRYQENLGGVRPFGKHDNMCPYAMYLTMDYDTTNIAFVETMASMSKMSDSKMSDSGVDTTASSSRTKFADDTPLQKPLLVFMEKPDESQFLEVFVTMGVVDLSLNVDDDASPKVIALRPPVAEPSPVTKEVEPEERIRVRKKREAELDRARRKKAREKETISTQSSNSFTLLVREGNPIHGDLDFTKIDALNEDTVQLLHVTLFQPNFYYWKRKTHTTLQLSLFDTTVALGTRENTGGWRQVVLSTAKGSSDPVTEIPPALATLKFNQVSAMNQRGHVTLDIERPVKADISTDTLSRLMGIVDLVKRNLDDSDTDEQFETITPETQSFLCEFKKKLTHAGIDTITIQTGQMSVCGVDGVVGWDGASLQVLASARPENVTAKLLITSLLVSAGPSEDNRHVLLQPLMLGMEAKAFWEAWRRAEGGLSAREPTIRVSFELDDLTLDLRPSEFATLNSLWRSVHELQKKQEMLSTIKMTPVKSRRSTFAGLPSGTSLVLKEFSQNSFNEPPPTKTVTLDTTEQPTPLPQLQRESQFESIDVSQSIYISPSLTTRQSVRLSEQYMGHQTTSKSALRSDIDVSDHFYKDDLRSGAFKILNGGQLPMAYQVVLSGDTVSWRYPHPRAITRIVAFPLPGQDTEIECVLELYSSMVDQWQPHTYFRLPVGEPRELQLFVGTPETVFGVLWRFRVCTEPPKTPCYEFHMKKFLPKQETSAQVREDPEEANHVKATTEVTAEQLSGVLRVDSYFAPRLLPRTKAIVRIGNLRVHLHNSLPPRISNQYLEGYYMSKPLIRTHRVLTLAARSTAAHALVHSPAGQLLVIDTNLSCDVMDTAMGTMEEVVEEFRLQSSLAVKESLSTARVRVLTSGIVTAMQVLRLRTLQALALDWQIAYEQYIRQSNDYFHPNELDTTNKSVKEMALATAQALEGRVCLWIHNSCSTTLRVGQKNTDEVAPLCSGTRLAYRWRYPTAPKKLRFAVSGPSADWKWSSSIPFVEGSSKLKIDTQAAGANQPYSSSSFLYVKVEESRTGRYMHLSGRLVLANMLRENLHYKVRSNAADAKQWQTVTSGELQAETVGRSVVCSSDCELVLKVKFTTHNTCWSGDIPLKECPKENVPWLVKVPTEGDYQFVSVWCRVVRGRADGRILATLWPLYVLLSHLPLDTDVTISSDVASVTADGTMPPEKVQTISGRGTKTHLHAPGTTSARHNLTFQYREIGSPVTRDAVPMHYGVTDSSVFDKRLPIMNIEDVIKDNLKWLESSASKASNSWPYSVVRSHWKDDWLPSTLQPRCDVTVRYLAVTAGGGCCLEIQLCPVVLLCNASPVSLTLRSFDAAPLCKVQAGIAISPPLAIIQKPFYISIEMQRETFVSPQLQVSALDPGRYGTPPPGHVALDHPTNFAVLCNQKVALLTLYYEIKQEINVLGVSSSFVLINRLNFNIMAAAYAVPDDLHDSITLRPKTYKIVPPTKETGPAHGLQMCKFWLRDRWRGGDPAELRLYLCLNLPFEPFSARTTVPIRLGQPPLRRAVALIDEKGQSIPVVVMQMKQDSRWVVVVSEDPCPQFVVHNHTQFSIAVAQPVNRLEEGTPEHVQAVPDCAGVKWCRFVPPDTAVHYSTPAHCARFPPPTMPPTSVASPVLTFSKGKDESELSWCPPVVVADGEQLLQYVGGLTIKLRVRIHPHSTLLELQDVDQNDISASDIRRRLQGAFKSEKAIRIAEPKLSRAASACEILSRPNLMTQPSESGVALRVSENIDLSTRTTTDLYPLNEQETQQGSTPRVLRTSIIEPTPNSGAENIDLTDRITTEPNQPPPPIIETQQDLNSRVGPPPESVAESIDFDRSTADLNQLHKLETQQGLYSRELIIEAQSKTHFLASASSACRFTSENMFPFSANPDLDELDDSWQDSERFRCVVASVVVEVSAATDVMPLLALHLDRTAILVQTANKKTKTTLSIADAQIDNLQYDTGQFDFAVVASTRAASLEADRWPPLWNMFAEREAFATNADSARLLLHMTHDQWEVVQTRYNELTELEVRLGTLALYVEDAYVKALVELSRLVAPAGADAALVEERSLTRPLRLRLLHVHPLDLTLTLHTAARMYIALDQSPLRLSEFKLNDMMTSAERLTHALTVHYLSAAILGAGWVVGGLELLGAPGALAARVGGATGGVRGVASAAAAALLRSLSAWAGSLARNLDLLAGDEEHARRAAAARRRPPPSLLAGLMAGITNFAINILGAVGGLAHHPLVGVVVGETESGATALRRGILGALTKPLSATADLVAYAGSGLLRQTGWDPEPEPREFRPSIQPRTTAGWQRDCVRWIFRLYELQAFSGFEVLLEHAYLQLLFTHKYLVVANPETERIMEMIDFRYCTLGPYQGEIIELVVTQTRSKHTLKLFTESARALDDDDEDYEISAAAMARVARYTGAGTSSTALGEARVLSLLPPPGRSHALHAALAAALHHNSSVHFPML